MKRVVLSFILAGVVTSFAFSQKLFKKIENAHEGQILSVAITIDGSSILTSGSDKRANMWDVQTGKIKEKGRYAGHENMITAVAFNSNDKIFATAGADNKLIVWDIKDGKAKRVLKNHTAEVTSVAFNPMNNNAVSGSKDKNVIIWDAVNGTQLLLLKGHTKQVNSVAFSPDGKYVVSGSADDKIIIWDASSGQNLNTITANLKGVNSVKYSADGKFIAGGGANGSVCIWDAKTGSKLTDFSEFKSQVNAVDFTPDVQYLAAAGDDGKIVIWNLEMQQIVKSLEANSKGVTAMVFNDKGNYLVSVGNDANIMIWDVTELNIGKKKFVAENNLEPKLTCSALTLVENNNNGIIEVSENAELNFIIKNQGQGQAYNLVAKVELDNNIDGLSFDKEVTIGNIGSDKSQKVVIPLKTTQELKTSPGKFKVTVVEANGHNPSPLALDFQVKGSNNSYIMVMDHKYSSATGKAEKGSPITMKLLLKNATNAEAKGIKINYILPANVVAVDKLSETIDFQPNELKEVNVQFYANESYSLPELKIDLNIEGAANTNLKDMNLVLAMNTELPVNTETYIAQNTSKDEPLYRGDPLKGLNISTAKKEMEIGSYYALIVGIDKYKGEWTPLKNAVQDAKALEKTLKEKYKLDYLKSLYDEQATRQNIIKAFEWLVANVKEKDNVLIYYSGHGDYKQELNKGYWVPSDAESNSTSNFISNSDIQTFLGGIKSKHTLLVSDACFSGDIFRGKTESIPFEDNDKYYQKVNELVSRQAITSGGIEPVMDGGKDGHSVFAYYLLKALTTNDYKYFDAGQLFSKIKVPVVNNSNQSPNFLPIKDTGDEGGQFIFMKK